jgi:hypothetical protein
MLAFDQLYQMTVRIKEGRKTVMPWKRVNSDMMWAEENQSGIKLRYAPTVYSVESYTKGCLFLTGCAQ